ncbi:uncharacterized protein LOC132559783 [Ylistrum balloti]|uniref:uncharacterized protein LOC132559783 n=1 Tax=Ylistrum balloti TaxID=509963 RepID=UPI002905AFB7|nr:uncharacterized protein LOC132559783 [Ylistrum balloti]
MESDTITSGSPCPNHSNETIKFLCQGCNNVKVCFQCILDEHYQASQHSVRLIVADTAARKDEKRQLGRNKLLEGVLNTKLRLCETNLKLNRDEIERRQQIKLDLQSAIEAREESLKQEVRKAKEKILLRVDKLFSDSKSHLEHNAECCENLRRELDEVKTHLQIKLESRNQTDLHIFIEENIAKYKKQMLPDKPDNSFYFTLSPNGTVEDIFGNLSNEPFKPETSKSVKEIISGAVIVKTLHTRCSKGIGKICPVSNQMAWIAYSNRTSIEKIDTAGTIVKVIETPCPVQDIAVDGDKDIVLTGMSTVWKKNLSDEKSIFSDIKNFKPFIVKGVTLATGQDILVCAQMEGNPGKVVRLSKEGEILLEICDVIGNPYRVAYNIFNDDIALACSENVLVYTKSGQLRTKWTGLRSQFNPHGIAYDNYGNILVTCYKNNLVYMLKEDQQEDGLILLDGKTQKMVTNPWSVAVDVSGKLWLAGNQGVIHIIKYSPRYE